MADQEAVRERTRAMWTAGDWDGFSRHVAPVGVRVLDGLDLEPGMDLLDVGTGSGGTVAIPAAVRGARGVSSDITPVVLEQGRRGADEAGVAVKCVAADAQEVPVV